MNPTMNYCGTVCIKPLPMIGLFLNRPEVLCGTAIRFAVNGIEFLSSFLSDISINELEYTPASLISITFKVYGSNILA